MTSQDVLSPISETETLRQQLLQAQRLSSVGALASSVAHEFNNILTTVINYAKLGQKAEDVTSSKIAFEKILKGGMRAAAIVGSMLGYARNHAQNRVPTDMILLVEEVLLLTEKDLSKHRIQVDKKYIGHPVGHVVQSSSEAFRRRVTEVYASGPRSRLEDRGANFEVISTDDMTRLVAGDQRSQTTVLRHPDGDLIVCSSDTALGDQVLLARPIPPPGSRAHR